MQPTTVTNRLPTPTGAAANGQRGPAAPTSVSIADRVPEVLAALEEPFDLTEIKWRVTNTCRVGGRNGPRNRGQMLAYADPRAYTDRLNTVFGPSGWTRDYGVQMVQNFEKKDRGTAERMITAKIVVTCRLTIHGLGTHSGLGEEWADNENSGTAAEAQAFKRACSCFGLGRYLYDLEGQWVDVDDRKQPLETPRLPDWALPTRHRTQGRAQEKAVSQRTSGAQSTAKQTPANRGRNGFYRNEVLEQVKDLSGKVGFSLSRGVLRAVANVDEADKVRDMAKLTSVLERLQDIGRGVERLNNAIAKAGRSRYSQLCKALNLAGESIGDIPDRKILRQMVEALEGASTRRGNGGTGEERSRSADSEAVASQSVSEARGELLQEANRISAATRRSLADVINRAANGAFHFATLKSLGDSDLANIQAALRNLRSMQK